jgi:exonuclease III
MIGPNLNIADWNVRGLNDQERKDTVHSFLTDTPCHIACIQETKLDFVDHQTAAYIGGFKLRSFAHRPAIGTRGGILLLWDDEHVIISDIHMGNHLISAMVSVRACGTSFKLTTVYGPSTDADKGSFLAEVIAASPANDQNWLLIGDFNLIYQAEDKNNDNLNFRLMGQFRRALTTCQLREIKLQNRKYTWSNERENPTLVRLDRAFCNAGWDLAFDNHVLHALSSSLSDHCPLRLSSPVQSKWSSQGTYLPLRIFLAQNSGFSRQGHSSLDGADYTHSSSPRDQPQVESYSAQLTNLEQGSLLKLQASASHGA